MTDANPKPKMVFGVVWVIVNGQRFFENLPRLPIDAAITMADERGRAMKERHGSADYYRSFSERTFEK